GPAARVAAPAHRRPERRARPMTGGPELRYVRGAVSNHIPRTETTHADPGAKPRPDRDRKGDRRARRSDDPRHRRLRAMARAEGRAAEARRVPGGADR